jgi:hypothetical protein
MRRTVRQHAAAERSYRVKDNPQGTQIHNTLHRSDVARQAPLQLE